EDQFLPPRASGKADRRGQGREGGQHPGLRRVRHQGPERQARGTGRKHLHETAGCPADWEVGSCLLHRQTLRGKTMGIRGRWRRLLYTVILTGIILGGILVYGRFVVQRPGGNPMNESRIVVAHVRLETDKPFEEVAKALGRELGALDPDVVWAAAESG